MWRSGGKRKGLIVVKGWKEGGIVGLEEWNEEGLVVASISSVLGLFFVFFPSASVLSIS